MFGISNVSRLILLPPLAALLLAPLSILFHVFLYTSVFWGYFLVAIFGLYLAKSSITKKTQLFFVAALSIIVLFISSTYLAPSEYNFIALLKIHIEPKFITCVENATKVSEQGVINVCERHDSDFLDTPITDAIVYDSTDQIVNAPSQRSEEWKTVARALDKKAPFGILNFSAVKINGHYYFVHFENTTALNSNL